MLNIICITRRGLTALTLCGLIAITTTAAADAATPSLGHQTSATPVSPRALSSTNGYTIANDSSAILEIEGSSGIDVPAPVGSNWLPGQTFDFELHQKLSLRASGEVDFEVFNVNGEDLGSGTLHFSEWDNNAKFYLSGVQQKDGRGNRFDVYSTGYKDPSHDQFQDNADSQDHHNQLRDHGAVDWELDTKTYQGPNGATLAQIAQGVMSAAGEDNSSYDVTSIVPGYSEAALLRQEADRDPADPDPNHSYGSITTEKGWRVEESNSLGVGVDAALGHVLKVGVEAEGTDTYSTGHDYSTTVTGELRPGQTTEIWAQAPITTAHGELRATLNSTTWSFANADFSFPDDSRVLSYRVTRVDGVNRGSIDQGVHN